MAVIRHTGRYVVCDRGNERSRMQIFTKNGHFIKKIAIRYIDIVAGLAISSQGEFYVEYQNVAYVFEGRPFQTFKSLKRLKEGLPSIGLVCFLWQVCLICPAKNKHSHIVTQ